MQAVIMAGGKGTRLRDITNDEIPKPMAPIAGKPILRWQVEHLREQGVSDIVMIIGHLGHKIREYFGDGTAFGIHIYYINETTPLGTAGALSMLPPLLKENNFFLVFGDVLFDIDLRRMYCFHQKQHALATLFIHPNSHPFDSDLVVCGEESQVLRFDSKNNVRNYWYHNCVNAGLYLMNREICQYVPPDTKVDMEKQLLPQLISMGKGIYGYQSTEYIKDVGTVERITKAEKELRSGYIAGRSLKRKQKAIFLDRDGTINRKNGLIYKEEQFVLEDCAVEAIKRINQSGYLAIVITNQPVVARGMCDITEVEQIHRKMETLLGQMGAYLDGIYFCPHHPDKGYPEENPTYKIHCCCRKPDIGMVEKAMQRNNIDLSKSWMIGDSTVDIQTGSNAGMHTALVLTGDAGDDRKYDIKPDLISRDLLQAVNRIIEGGFTDE